MFIMDLTGVLAVTAMLLLRLVVPIVVILLIGTLLKHTLPQA
jgi:hypothetical protein